MISALFDKTVEVKRLADVPGGNKKTFASHIAALPCLIQPVDEKTSEDLAGSFGKNWLLMCNPADIIEDDRVIDGDREYRVMSSTTLSFNGEEHTEVILRIFDV